MKTIQYKGKTIYINDWKNLKNSDQFKPKIEEGNKNTQALIEQGKTNILTLTDITGSFVFGDTVQLLNQASKLANGITKKSATVGLTGGKKVILNSINVFAKSDVKAFNTIEEAKEWLVK
ncbi:MAG: hypothetical protein U9N85_12065 [Bacteroidota bacterium]|nr:hypothetical protein [Bacteroidota bacterium]